MKYVKVRKEGQRRKSRGTEEVMAFVVCHVSRLCLRTTTSQLVKLNEIFSFLSFFLMVVLSHTLMSVKLLLVVKLK